MNAIKADPSPVPASPTQIRVPSRISLNPVVVISPSPLKQVASEISTAAFQLQASIFPQLKPVLAHWYFAKMCFLCAGMQACTHASSELLLLRRGSGSQIPYIAPKPAID